MSALALPLAALLAQAAPPAAADPGVSVVVEGRRLSPVQRAERVVEALTQLSPTDDLIVRRFYAACPRVVGVTAGYARALEARLAAAAALVGLPPARPGCEPDVLVVFTADVDRFIDSSTDLRGWRGWGDGFVTAVRRRPDAGPRRVAVFKAYLEAPAPASTAATHLSSQVVDRYDRTVIVLQDLLSDRSAALLGDYLAMLALTSADETSVSPEPSVLNLLLTGGAEAPHGFTPRDRAYLRAYYKADVDKGSATTLGQIARQMLREEESDAAAAAAKP